MIKTLKNTFLKGVPAKLMHPDLWNETLELPTKKAFSEKFCQENNTYPISFPHYRDVGDPAFVTQRAISAAISMRYLRAVAILFFTSENVTIRMIHPLENIVSADELIGALLLAYLSMQEMSGEEVAYFTERDATHMIGGDKFVEVLRKSLVPPEASQILVVNIHHDFITLHHNITQLHPVLQAVRGLKLTKPKTTV